MRVLQKGSGAKSWSRRVKCSGNGNGGGGCGALLLVEKTDLFNTFRSSYDGSSETFTTFECPECKVLTDIETPFVHDKLPNQKEWRARCATDQ